MQIRGYNRLQRATRRIRNRVAPGDVILMYHRVAEATSDPWSLCVTPQHFAEQMEVLQDHSVISLSRLSQADQDRKSDKARSGKRGRRSVVVTFDDGYADNLYQAKPLLEQWNVAATVFLTAGHIGCEREFWWDELDQLLLQPGTLPEVLEMTFDNSIQRWELGDATEYGAEDSQRYRGWRVSSHDDPTPRHLLYRSLYQLWKPLSSEHRQRLLDELAAWAGAGLVARSTHRTMSGEEVNLLRQGGLIEIGAHTMTHPYLSTLPLALQRSEIEDSKIGLEKIVGRPITSFAYPHGDYMAATPALLQQAGFVCACSTAAGLVRQSSDRFRLPRFMVQDWGGDRFARHLDDWFGG